MLGKIVLESQKYREAPPCGWCLKQESDPKSGEECSQRAGLT